MEQKTVLITGGTGLVGGRLTELLLERGYKVSYLSRRKEVRPDATVYRWDPDKNYIEDEALETADYLVLLAGAGIADERWTAKRKKELMTSRTTGTTLIANELQKRPYKIKACVAASGIGFYGADTGDEHLAEDDASGTDFVSHLTRTWETASELVANVGIRTSILRIGIVLSNKGGALPRMAMPVRWFVGGKIGGGRQWVSWIHIDDLCEMIIQGLENQESSGIFNAVSPNPVTNAEFMRQIGVVLKRPVWLPLPIFVLRLIFGELSNLISGGNYVLNQRMKKTAFSYRFEHIGKALENLLEKS